MCGIVGIISKNEYSVKDILLGALKSLEYRGYDSAGLATINGVVKKSIGDVDQLRDMTEGIISSCAISHTRWATHGSASITNAHPHSDERQDIFVVHNGIIENYREIRNSLEKKGYRFISSTDSEVIPHFFASCLDRGIGIVEACRLFIDEAKGTFAMLLIRKGIREIVALKRDSPLIICEYGGRITFSSDMNALSRLIGEAYFLEDNHFCIAGEEGISFYDPFGKVYPTKEKINPSSNIPEKVGFDHYMYNEICEQPFTLQRMIGSLEGLQKGKLLDLAGLVRSSGKVLFASCGTSYHASLIGVYLLRLVGIDSQTVIASEFMNYLSVDQDTVVIALTQSGETMDVLGVLKDAKKDGAKIVSFVNVSQSTISRISSVSIELLAGPEISVASTKSFTHQVIALYYLACLLGYNEELGDISSMIRNCLMHNEKKIIFLAKDLCRFRDIFVIGKGITYPCAREIALKFKEISYIHAEGMMAGELKHGTIALIEPGVPVIVFGSGQDSASEEVKARGAKLIRIGKKPSDLLVMSTSTIGFMVCSVVLGHLLSYYTAKELGLPIDKPRNLAKSVTVK